MPGRRVSLLKTGAYVLVLAAFLGGAYHAWQTGAILKGLEWLKGQDPIILTVIAVAGLMALAVGLGGD